MMMRARTLALLVVVAHWMVAMWHLFLAAQVLPAPDNQVTRMAVILITLGHVVVSVALWFLSERFAGWTSLIFFLAAMSADLYEHFLPSSGNSIFVVGSGHWAIWFDISVFILLALEILGCAIGAGLAGGWGVRNKVGGIGRGSMTAPGRGPSGHEVRMTA